MAGLFKPIHIRQIGFQQDQIDLACSRQLQPRAGVFRLQSRKILVQLQLFGQSATQVRIAIDDEIDLLGRIPHSKFTPLQA